MNAKIITHAKKIIIAILADTFVRIARNLKSIADTTVIAYGEISFVTDIESTKKYKYYSKNVSINCHSKKVRYRIDCYIFHSCINHHITIDNYYYLLP